MLFTAHLFDTNPLTAIRRKAPTADNVAGLVHAETAITAPFTKRMPKAQLGREAMIACWEDDASIDRFLADDELGRVANMGWHVRLELVRSVGIFPSLPDIDYEALCGDKAKTMTGPGVAITCGTAHGKTLPQFAKASKPLDTQFLEASGTLWGTALVNVRTRFVASITVWDSLDSASKFMKEGAHANVMRKHYDPAVEPNGHEFVNNGGFLGFRPLSMSGSVGGTNSVHENVLSQV